MPIDVKVRELHNLQRWLPGFEASQINFKATSPWGSRSSPTRTTPMPPRPRCRISSSMRRPSRHCTSRWPRRSCSSKEELIQMLWTKVNACELVEIILILHMLLHFTHPHQLFQCGEMQAVSRLVVIVDMTTMGRILGSLRWMAPAERDGTNNSSGGMAGRRWR